MAKIVLSSFNDLLSRFRDYFYDSALLYPNSSSKHCLELRKHLFNADSVIIFDKHFVQLDHGFEN